MNELPTRGPNDPPLPGKHRIVGEPGITEHLVFAGPNTMPRPAKTSWLREIGHYLYAVGFVFSIVVGAIAAGILALEYPQLTVTARLACATITVLICTWAAVRHARLRKLRRG